MNGSRFLKKYIKMRQLLFEIIIIFGCFAISYSRDYAIEMIDECNYPSEVHSDIQTADGYLLTMQRIPHGRKGPGDKKRTPVLVMHGLLGSAENFLLLGCRKSLPYLLSDEGYDVWLGNVRSVSYSRHHVTLDPDRKEYWNFTFEHFGNYDGPALIDYILAETGSEQLMYIGHSQGTFMFYLMCNFHPQYADKVKLFVNLSPIGSFTDLPHPWLPIVCAYEKQLWSWTERIGLLEWTFGRDFVRKFGHFLCLGPLKQFCKSMVYFFSGMKPSHVHDGELERLLRNAPEGISSKQMVHGCQMYKKRALVSFDYRMKDVEFKPVYYTLNYTTTPTALYYSKYDWFLAEEQAEKIGKELPNVVDFYSIPVEDFSHFDFLMGQSAPDALYKRILNLMQNYNRPRGRFGKFLLF